MKSAGSAEPADYFFNTTSHSNLLRSLASIIMHKLLLPDVPPVVLVHLEPVQLQLVYLS